MKIAHVVPAVSEEASGPSYSVPRLCEALIAHGQDVTLAALDWSPGVAPRDYLRTFPLGVGPRRLGRSPALKRWLREQVRNGGLTIVHNHGMWQMNALYPGQVSRGSDCRLVVSPRGAFSAWAMRSGSIAKRVFWPLLQQPTLRRVACFHATSESEYADIRRLGFRDPVAVIPNGVDVPGRAPDRSEERATKTVLFLGRINPVKGLDLLLPAWADLQASFPGWRLWIVGDDTGYGGSSGYLHRMRRLAAEVGARRVEFAGELKGEAKWDAYRRSDLFVLPSYSENFGVAVAEALSSGLPAVVSHGAPWHGLEAHGAGWWVATSRQALAAALGDAMSRSDDERRTMGSRGRRWMLDEFTWEHIGEKMLAAYQWLTDPADAAPVWIRRD